MTIVDKAWDLQYRIEARFKKIDTKRIVFPLKMFAIMVIMYFVSGMGTITTVTDIVYFSIGFITIAIFVLFFIGNEGNNGKSLLFRDKP